MGNTRKTSRQAAMTCYHAISVRHVSGEGWLALHLRMDMATGRIVAEELMRVESDASDPSSVACLLATAAGVLHDRVHATDELPGGQFALPLD